MTTTGFSRRGFLTRLGAGAAGVAGSSFVGGAFTRASAGPLRNLPNLGTHAPSVVAKPQSIVFVDHKESLRRERYAYELPAVRELVSDLTGRGYQQVGKALGVDGVAGYVTEGGHGVGLGFARAGEKDATVFVAARWWDQPALECDHQDSMPDIFSSETILGGPDQPHMVRFRYVGDRGSIMTREEIVEPSQLCGTECHLHTHGPCPSLCDGVCKHCTGPRNVCQGYDPDCENDCAATCFLACLAVAKYHWTIGAACSIACGITCDNQCQQHYCCDFQETICCTNTTFPFLHCFV